LLRRCGRDVFHGKTLWKIMGRRISAFLSEKYFAYEVRQVKNFQKIFPKTE
jgi:hypothetical protein